jgi:AraC family transcriptional regulator, ethanolamine operon transcriptional activator
MLHRLMTNFDRYSDNVRELTESLFLLTAPPTAVWDLVWCPLHRTVMQFGVEGGAKIFHGIARPDAIFLLFQSTQFSDCAVADGHPVHGSDVLVLPPSLHVSVLTKRSHQWIALSVPSELIDELAGSDARYSILQASHKTIITLPPTAMKRLAEAAFTTRYRLKNAPIDDPQTIEVSLLDLVVDVLSGRTEERQLGDSRTDPCDFLMTSALEFVRTRPSDKILIDDIAAAAGVNERTLLRAFNHYFEIGPKQYLKLRQLNLVRRMLRQRRADRNSATSIMSNYGVTEFGRFAVEYKNLFGESPSDTLRAPTELDDAPDVGFDLSATDQPPVRENVE